MRQFVALLIVSFLGHLLVAQPMAITNPRKPVVQQLNLGAGLGGGSVLLNISLLRSHQLNPANRVRLGYALNAQQFRATRALNYIAIGSAADTFLTENPVIHSANLGFYAAYFFNPLLELGVYGDIVGLSIGPEQDGAYHSPEEPGVPHTVGASPEPFNFFFAGRGSYQTSLFLRYWVGERLGLLGGITWYRSTYRTAQPMNNEQRRFRNTYLLGRVALSYRWD